jgi:type I restriction enzyme S subunit
MNNITYEGEINISSLKYISQNEALEKYLVNPGDILFNRTNSIELVGKTAVYMGPTPMAFAGYLVKGVTKPVNRPEYISAFMNSNYGKKLLKNMCKSIVGMANINAKEFGSIKIAIPPTDLQEKFTRTAHRIQSKKIAMSSQFLKMETLIKSLQNNYFN